MTWQSKEDQSDHIRSQLLYEIKNPGIWYPKQKETGDKLNNGLSKKQEREP